MIPTFPGYARAAAQYYTEPQDDYEDEDRELEDLESEEAGESGSDEWLGSSCLAEDASLEARDAEADEHEEVDAED